MINLWNSTSQNGIKQAKHYKSLVEMIFRGVGKMMKGLYRKSTDLGF